MIIGLIPARLNSKRLPNKPIKIIDKLPLVIHVLKRSLLAKKLDKVIVCADDKKIVDIINKHNGNAYITSKKFKNGTERISSFIKQNLNKFKNKLKLVIDIQCDEVFLNPKYLDKLIDFHLKNLNNFDVVIPHSLTKQKNNKNYVKLIFWTLTIKCCTSAEQMYPSFF